MGMRPLSIPGVVFIILAVSACGSSVPNQTVAAPTPGASAGLSPTAQPIATAQASIGLPSTSAIPTPSLTAITSPSMPDRTRSAECVNPSADVLTLAYQSDPVACYGNASLTVDAYLTGGGAIDGPCLYVEPAWLGNCGSFVALDPVLDRSKFSPSLFAAVDPATGGVLEALLGRNVRVAGHYDDPAARLCHPTGGFNGTPAETPHPGSTWVNACRATFVLTSIVLSAP